MSGYRKLGRTTSQRKAMLRALATNLLANGRIITTETRAKEVRPIVEHLIAMGIREKDNVQTVTVKAKVARKDKDGKRIKEVVDGKKVTVYDEVEKTITKDMPSRLHARRQMIAQLYPVTKVAASGKAKDAVEVDLADKLLGELATKYADKKGEGGYTRIIKIGPRKGDAAMEVVLELI